MEFSRVLFRSDITQRRRMELSVRASEDRLKLAEETVGLGTWDLDVAADRAHCSPKLLQLYGRSGEGMAGEEWQSSIHPDDRASVRSDLDASLQTGQPFNRRFRV